MKRYILIVTVAILAASCANMLDTAPADQISSGNMWTNEDLADQGMNGLYKNFYVDTPSADRIDMSASGIQGLDRQGWISLEFQSFARTESLSYMLTDATKRPDRYAISYDWEWGYTGIHRINDALENLGNAGLSTEKYERYVCEARFLRAWYYSFLNKIYQGVPVYLEVVSNEECTKGASTSEEVWNVVLDDLNYCLENDNFPENTLSTNYGRPSKGAAYALRGMAYMWLAWEKGEDSSYYQLAADDFEKVAECGYGLFTGSPVDFYNDVAYEKDHEMIFPVQFDTENGYGDYIDVMFGSGDTYEDQATIRASSAFVDYFQNADGSQFKWTDVTGFEGWDDAVFQSDISKREVYFLRDSISVDSSGKVLSDYWNTSEQASLQERVNMIGVDVFNKYYLKDGNEERLQRAYANRDPRLNMYILTPYEDYVTYNPTNGENLVKQLRWPYLKTNRSSANTDLYLPGSLPSTYIYKKFVRNEEGQLEARLRTPNDWPLIHYTDIYLYLAECYYHLGRSSEALSIVNEIRSRAGMPNVSGSADVMEAIRYERRVELCCEGVDWFDEWRWGTYKDTKFQGKDIYGAQSLWGQYESYFNEWYYQDYMFPWSAPSGECSKNPNLHIRDGWNY